MGIYSHLYCLTSFTEIYDCITEDLPHGLPPPELPPRSPTSTEATLSLPPNQPDLLQQISARGPPPQSSNEGKISYT